MTSQPARGDGDDAGHPPLHPRPDPRGGPGHDPVARHAGAVGIQPPAVPLPRAARRARRRSRPRRCSGASFREMWQVKVAHDRYDEGSGADGSSPKARMARTMQHFVDHFEETPVVVLPCLVRYRDPTPTEGASIYPACQNLLLAARALGYGGVMTTWHQLVEDELRDAARHPRRRGHRRHDPAGQAGGPPRPGAPPPPRRARLRRPLGRPGRLGRRPRGHPLHQRRPTPLTTSVRLVGIVPKRTDVARSQRGLGGPSSRSRRPWRRRPGRRC